MKKIMVVGAGVYQLPLIETAMKYGNVIIAAPEVPENIKSLVYNTLIIDVRAQDEICKFAEEEKIDAIVTDQTDIAVRTVAYVAEKLGLPGIGYDTAVLFTDKSKMRERCAELGLPILPNKKVRTLSDARDFYLSLNSDVIIKPVDNQGSRGVARITCVSDLEAKFDEARNYSATGDVLIEKMAYGREFVVEGVTTNYNYHTLICGDTSYFNIPDAFSAKSRIFPSNADDELVTRVCELNKQIIEGFGLVHGITHSEFIMDGNEIYLIETAARGGGVFISSDLINLGSGLHTEEYLIETALGYEYPINLKQGMHCCYMAFYISNGVVNSIEGIDDVKNLEYVHRNLLDEIHLGMEVKNCNDKTSRYSIIVSADSRKELMERMSTIQSMLKIISKDQNGNENGIIWE